LHAVLCGEHITSMGGHPSLRIGALLETHKHSINDILTEAHAHESEALQEYRKLLGLVRDRSIMLEEFARTQIAAEEEHLAEVRKMLRSPGSI
jgi:bacterioferritin